MSPIRYRHLQKSPIHVECLSQAFYMSSDGSIPKISIPIRSRALKIDPGPIPSLGPSLQFDPGPIPIRSPIPTHAQDFILSCYVFILIILYCMGKNSTKYKGSFHSTILPSQKGIGGWGSIFPSISAFLQHQNKEDTTYQIRRILPNTYGVLKNHPYYPENQLIQSALIDPKALQALRSLSSIPSRSRAQALPQNSIPIPLKMADLEPIPGRSQDRTHHYYGGPSSTGLFSSKYA